jgi:hypothetical protein
LPKLTIYIDKQMGPGLPAEVLLVQKGQQIPLAGATDRPNQRSRDGAGYRQKKRVNKWLQELPKAYCSEVNRLRQELPKVYCSEVNRWRQELPKLYNTKYIG